MDRTSAFSYTCKQCGRCCHDQVITLSPYDLLKIARAAGIGTRDARARYTVRRGSILKFTPAGGCCALDGGNCGIHRGRPLACRLYPLGLERIAGGGEKFVRLKPAAGSLGLYGDGGIVNEFLTAQDVDGHLEMNSRYARILPLMRERIAALVDFEASEPREFWRVAVREALAESAFDANPLIDAMFDADGMGCARGTGAATVDAHVCELKRRIRGEADPVILAAAAVMLAVSLGYSPTEAIGVA